MGQMLSNWMAHGIVRVCGLPLRAISAVKCLTALVDRNCPAALTASFKPCFWISLSSLPSVLRQPCAYLTPTGVASERVKSSKDSIVASMKLVMPFVGVGVRARHRVRIRVRVGIRIRIWLCLVLMRSES